jgi:hypothetical protein
MFSEHRDMAAAKAFFESAKMVTGVALVQIFRLPIFARLDELKAARWRGSRVWMNYSRVGTSTGRSSFYA